MNLCDIRDIHALMRRHGFSFSKGLGQNFLCDASVPPLIAEGAGLDSDTCVLEVGPGVGALTQQLCKHAKSVICVELDRRLPPLLDETLSAFDNVRVVTGDILKIDIRQLCADHFGAQRAVVCANLPYYITTPAITALIESGAFDSVTVMVQKEVAQRICARAGTASYGAFTVYVNNFADARLLFEVPQDSFVPAPKVDSAVIRLDLLDMPRVAENQKLFFRVVKACFAQRRKTLLNCLYSAFSAEFTKEQLKELLKSCDINSESRGETLELKQFEQIAQKLREKIG